VRRGRRCRLAGRGQSHRDRSACARAIDARPAAAAGAGGPFTGATPAGFIDRGVQFNRRVFEMPSRLRRTRRFRTFPGAVYLIAGPVNVGTDVGGDGAAAGGQQVT
jgi:hypothetical protein